MLTPSNLIECILSLPLLVLWIFANDVKAAASFDHFARIAYFLYRTFDFHGCFFVSLNVKINPRRARSLRCRLPEEKSASLFPDYSLLTILPLLPSGESSTRTLSPGNTRIRCRRIRPAKCPSTSCPFETSFIRNLSPGNASFTIASCPSCINSLHPP